MNGTKIRLTLALYARMREAGYCMDGYAIHDPSIQMVKPPKKDFAPGLLNWDEAPVDATHVSPTHKRFPWRKRQDGSWLYWKPCLGRLFGGDWLLTVPGMDTFYISRPVIVETLRIHPGNRP